MLFDPVPFVRDTFVLFGADGRTLRALGLGAVSGTRELFTGAGCLLALVFLFFPAGVWRGGERRAAVFALVSGGVLLLLYSAIAYKTPWLTLGVLPPLWLAAGLGFAALWRRCRAVRVAVPVVFAGALVAAGIGVHANAAHFLSRRFAADSRNPLAYVHTTDDAQNVALRARRLLAFASKTEPILVRVYVREYWPLPWYLKGTAGGVGFWRSVPAPDEGGETLDAPVVITDESTEEAVAPRLREKYVMDFMGLRPGVLLIVRLREDLHKRMLAAETP
jgi:predicted membrane-bound mannosyltransferase